MNDNTATRIAITRDNLPKVIAKAYDLSQPQGMGFLQAQPGAIPHDVLQRMLDHSDSIADSEWRKGISMDYVQGRAVKLHIHFDTAAGTYYLEDTGRNWYDHSDEQWAELLTFARAVTA